MSRLFEAGSAMFCTRVFLHTDSEVLVVRFGDLVQCGQQPIWLAMRLTISKPSAHGSYTAVPALVCDSYALEDKASPKCPSDSVHDNYVAAAEELSDHELKSFFVGNSLLPFLDDLLPCRFICIRIVYIRSVPIDHDVPSFGFSSDFYRGNYTRYTFAMQKSAKVLSATIVVLLFVTVVIWVSLTQASSGAKLRVTFLDVGQGDAIFIQSPSGLQMLLDGGKNRAVIRELSRAMPWFDRSIDVVLATHPDADHIGGLPDVLKRYDVDLIVQSSVLDVEGADEKALDAAAEVEEREGARRLIAERGQMIDLGNGAFFEVLFPDRDVPGLETNTGSIVGRLVYGDTSFMLTGDSPQAIEEYLVKLDAGDLKSNILKAGHHGSRTSSSLQFVGWVSPEYAVFSRGCDNSYGHPHGEPVAVFARLGVETFDTCEDGSVTFVSDGKKVVRE